MWARVMDLFPSKADHTVEGMAEGLFQGPWACGLTMLPAYATCDTQMHRLDKLSICAMAPMRYKL